MQRHRLVVEPDGRGPVLGARFTVIEAVERGPHVDEFIALDDARRARAQADREVWIKCLHSEDVVAKGRFINELRILTELDHPNVVAIAQGGTQQGSLTWFAMDLPSRMTLADRVDAGDLSTDDLCDIAFGLLDGLHAVHEKGFLHRGVHPGAILIGGYGEPVLARFDAARSDLDITQRHEQLGHVDYAAPEQIDNAMHADETADLYAVGATLFRAASGMSPLCLYDANVRVEALEAVDARLRSWVDVMTRIAPDERPHSATAARIALEAVL